MTASRWSEDCSTPTTGEVNAAKEAGWQPSEGTPPRDGEARSGGKGKRRQRKDCQALAETEWFYGYKIHNSLNTRAEMITSIVVTVANGPDGKQSPELVRKDGELELPAEVCSADRGCDDGEDHCLLETLGLQSAIPLNRYRTVKKDRSKEVWIPFMQSPAYRVGQLERHKIDGKCGRGTTTMD